jgi:predicted nucleic acid-binding Zn ribbon protein
VKARHPHALGEAVGRIRAASAPKTPLAAVEMAWPDAVGPGAAAEATPVSERDGVVTVACRSATWAQELDLLGPEILERLNAALERPLKALRFTADAARHDQHQ